MSEPVEYQRCHGNHLHEDMISREKGFALARGGIAEEIKSKRQSHRPNKYIAIGDAEFGQRFSRQKHFAGKGTGPPISAPLYFAKHQENPSGKSCPFCGGARKPDPDQPAAEYNNKNGGEDDVHNVQNNLQPKRQPCAANPDEPSHQGDGAQRRGQTPKPRANIIGGAAFNLGAGGENRECPFEQRNLQRENQQANRKANRDGAQNMGLDFGLCARAVALRGEARCRHA